MPPYIDVIANLFSANVMRKHGATAPGGKTSTAKKMPTSARTSRITTTNSRR